MPSLTKLIQSCVIAALACLLTSACGVDSQSLESIFQSKKDSYPLTTKHLNDQGEPLFVNRLIKQDSLYLLQHANNPVQWWGWGDAAFAKAKELNKPIFLSIGYSTCHWCHVMARESFESIEVANYLNEHFIPIKVDREEHPSVDELYLTSVQMLSGKAGWPLTAVLTPDGQAFFGGTYFQPRELLNLLNRISDTWVQRREAVLEQANRLTTSLEAINKSSGDAKAITSVVIAEAARRVNNELTNSTNTSSNNRKNRVRDSKAGFPREPEMLFLLDQARRDLSSSTIKTVSERLLKLAAAGIHDQVDGGFHRYTVDSGWVVPHFEKMLYNQAQMGQAYFQAYQLDGNPALKEVGQKTFDFLLRTMQSPDGGFYSAMDAESEQANGDKSEGAYYIWAHQELESLLSSEQLQLAEQLLGVSLIGNFNGHNVLQNQLYDTSSSEQQSEQSKQVALILKKLSATRAQRKQPHIDTKIITSWNAMVISALLVGHQIVGDERYRTSALKAAERIWLESYNSKQGLARTIPSAKLRVAGALEDYAYLTNAMIDAYDATANKKWLNRATEISTQMIERFHDAQTGGFNIADASQTNAPTMRLVTARDDATYSGNSVSARALARLLARTGTLDFKHKANATIAAFSKQLLANPETLSGMLLAANTLNNGDLSAKQYAAKGKISIQTMHLEADTFAVDLTIADGWHVNAAKVLSDYLIPTTLTAATLENTDSCSISSTNYPNGQRVSLGFQEDELLVYEKTTRLKATTTSDQSSKDCKMAAAELRIQACSDEICLAPEVINIRAF